MKTIDEAQKKSLKKQFEKAVNDYVDSLLFMWDADKYYGYFVSDEVGGVYVHEAGFSLNMDEIIFCVENDVAIEKYWEFVEYIQKCDRYNFKKPNLQSYIKGCPTIPQETFDRLDAMRAELEKCVEETKNKF